MAYTVKINGFEVVCETMDDVRALVGVPSNAVNERPAHPQTQATKPRDGSQDGNASDHALLSELVKASNKGIPSTMVKGLLNAHGKGMPGAIERWEARLGLPSGSLEKTIVDRARGWKLTDAAQAAAKVILGT